MKCIINSCASEAEFDSNYCNLHRRAPGRMFKFSESISLEDLQLELRAIEQNQQIRLVALSGLNVIDRYVTVAEFRESESVAIAPLELRGAKTEGEADRICASETSKGRRLIERSRLVLQGVNLHVLVFR